MTPSESSTSKYRLAEPFVNEVEHMCFLWSSEQRGCSTHGEAAGPSVSDGSVHSDSPSVGVLSVGLVLVGLPLSDGLRRRREKLRERTFSVTRELSMA